MLFPAGSDLALMDLFSSEPVAGTQVSWWLPTFSDQVLLVGQGLLRGGRLGRP